MKTLSSGTALSFVALALALTQTACSSSASTTDSGNDVAPGAETGADVAQDVVTGMDVLSAPDAASDVPSATDVPPASDGPILPPVDAGNPFGDGGALGEPAWVPIDVRTSTMCDPLTPCGGDVVGTWDVTGGCVELPLMNALVACTGARVTSATGRARGRVVFDGAVAHRIAQSEVEVDLFVPAVCAGFVGGCPAIQTAVQRQVPDSACVATATGDCNCAARQTNTINDTDGYSIAGNEIVSATLGRHWAYCISPTTSLRYQDTTPGTTAREPGIIQLGRR